MVPVSRWLKDLLPHGLLGRSLLILVTPILLVQLVSTYVFYMSHWENVARRLAVGLGGDIGAVIESLRAFPDPDSRLKVLHIAAARMDLDIRFDENGILPNLPPRKPVGAMERALYIALGERVQRPFQVDSTSYEREIAIRVQLSEGVLEVFAPRKRLWSSTTYVFLLWMAGTSLLLMGIATIFMRNQVRSVRRLATAVDRFGRGLDVPNFKAEGATEVRQAAQAFNLMRERILRQIQQRTEMLAGVSHDLRTPLTRMKLQLAIMGEVEGCVELAEDVAEMEHMVEGYLAFARGEGGEKSISADLAAVVTEVVGRYLRQGKDVDIHAEAALYMPLRPHAIARAIGNLIGNAARYAPHVRVRVGLRKDGAEVVVDDDGPGIRPDHREDVFKPFTRGEASRNRQTGGVGLGLTIARDIIRGHGGDIFLEDSPLGGLRARVRLPV
jgi:two-component system, OmpR family, osmolarity sensor histidine kinase EnvZ